MDVSRRDINPKKRAAPENFGALWYGLHSSGFTVLPVRGKAPFLPKWEGLWERRRTESTVRQWAEKNPDANVGLCLGEIIAVDIDIDDPAGAEKAQELAFSCLGSTSYIRVGRTPRRTLFYRLPLTEAYDVESWKEGNIELLAQRRQSVIYGIHPDTGNPFKWPRNDLRFAKPSDLPPTSREALEALRKALKGVPSDELEMECSRLRFDMDYVPVVGERAEFLFWYARRRANAMETLAGLEADVIARNASFPEPLRLSEAQATARTVWGYKVSGTLRVPGENPLLVTSFPRKLLEEVVPKLHPAAAKLLMMLMATRDTRFEFSIPQQATADVLHMAKKTLQKGLKELLACGLLVDTGKKRGGSSNWRGKKLYRFGDGTPPRAQEALI